MGDGRPTKSSIPIRTSPPELASIPTSTTSHPDMETSTPVSNSNAANSTSRSKRTDKSPARWSEASADHPKSSHDDNDDSSIASDSDNDDDDESVISQAHSAAQSAQARKGRARSKSTKSRASPDDPHKVAVGRVSKKPKKKANRFACTGYDDCNLSFTRSEHLIRHIRKHTGERPYECHCGRRFSRLDNLRQHASTVHANEEIPNDSLAASVAGFRRPGTHDDVMPMSSMPMPPLAHARSLSHPNNSLIASGPAPVYGSAPISGAPGHHPGGGGGPVSASLASNNIRPVSAEYSSSPYAAGNSYLPPPGHSAQQSGPSPPGPPGPLSGASGPSSSTPSRRPVRGHNKAFSTSNIAYDPREARSQPYPKYQSARPPQLPPLSIERSSYEDQRQQQQHLQQQQQQQQQYAHSAHPSVSSSRDYLYSHRPVTPTDCPTPASATFSHTAGSPGWEHNTITSPMSHTSSLNHSHSQSQSHAHNRTRSMVTPGANGFSHSHSTPSTLGQLNHGRRYPDGLLMYADTNRSRRMSVPSLNGGSPPYESPASYRMHERRDSFEHAVEDSRRRSVFHSPPMQPRHLQVSSPPDSPTRRSSDVRLPGIQSLLPSTADVPFSGFSRAPMPTVVHQRHQTSVRFADDEHPAHAHAQHAHAQRQRDMEYQYQDSQHPPSSSSSSSSSYPFRGHSYTESAPLNSISGRPSRNFRRMARHMEEEEQPRVSTAASNNMSGGSRQHLHPSNPNVTTRTSQMEHPNLTQFGFPGREPPPQSLPPLSMHSSPQQPTQPQRMTDMARLDALVAVATSQKEKPLTARV
ncbi:zinc c2h2 finger domain containing protein [Ophiostoma piceae UAMH 11346]|uniref:Zinc c2h2 finger domain containing protein n=1 Tax=Ophiostoma piceae (strain UAMH 11346) TaxID=1262450 RepID=S3BV57_OPHP1|nr:zinc c2h2 finger domain containing protein [Ophiostoma piceae UAMH 11346]